MVPLVLPRPEESGILRAEPCPFAHVGAPRKKPKEMCYLGTQFEELPHRMKNASKGQDTKQMSQQPRS